MNKKWLKLGLILGGLAIIAFLFLELFFWDYLAMRRFLKEEKIATQIYFDNKNTFDEIRLLSDEFPSYDLDLNEKGKNYLTLDLNNSDSDKRLDDSHLYYYEPQFLQGPIDTFINGEQWLIKIENATNDTLVKEGLNFFKNNFTKFEKIRDGIKQINSTHISSIKNNSTHIRIKDDFPDGLQYSYYHFDTATISVEDQFYFRDYLGEKIDEHFYFNLYELNPLFCGFEISTWMVPESRFE